MAVDQIQHDDQWDECPPGELSRMVERVDAKQRYARRKQVYGTALVSTAVFACVVLAVGSLMGPTNNLYGGIKCSECRSHFSEYQLHAIGESLLEDEALVTSMKTHLEKCSICRGNFNELYPGILSANHLPATRPVALLAWQPMFAVGTQRLQ